MLFWSDDLSNGWLVASHKKTPCYITSRNWISLLSDFSAPWRRAGHSHSSFSDVESQVLSAMVTSSLADTSNAHVLMASEIKQSMGILCGGMVSSKLSTWLCLSFTLPIPTLQTSFCLFRALPNAHWWKQSSHQKFKSSSGHNFFTSCQQCAMFRQAEVLLGLTAQHCSKNKRDLKSFTVWDKTGTKEGLLNLSWASTFETKART